MIFILLAFAPGSVFPQTDEIQVYDGSIAGPGRFSLTLHSNFAPAGVKAPAFPGGLIADRSFNGAAEWAWGVTTWFEAGLYFPLYSVSRNRGATINGGKIRFLFAAPNAASRTFFYGANFEFSCNSMHWDQKTFTSEIRPIIGFRFHRLDIIANPILDNSFAGGFGNLEFAPAARIAYRTAKKWALAAEEYAAVGPLNGFEPTSRESHQLFGVLDYSGRLMDVEFGLGFGLTPVSDKIVLKLILSRDLN
jgi:hypothetical protein